VNGGCEGLYSCISAFMGKGLEAVIIDPSYDFYRPQILLMGGMAKGVPLFPKKRVNLLIFSCQNYNWKKDANKS